jgi:hypothetical protein
MYDPINKPRHYNLGIETSEYIKSWDMDYYSGNVIKYVTRAPHKGKPVEDLQKAKWYLEQLIIHAKEEEEEDQVADFRSEQCTDCMRHTSNCECDVEVEEEDDDWANSDVPLDIHGHPWDAKKFEKDEEEHLKWHLQRVAERPFNSGEGRGFPPGWPYEKEGVCPSCEVCDARYGEKSDWRSTGVEEQICLFCGRGDDLCDCLSDAYDIKAEVDRGED